MKKLPSTIVIEAKKESIISDIQFIETLINNRLQPLFAAERISLNTDILNELSGNKEAINGIVDNLLKEYLSNFRYLPEIEEKRIKASFSSIKERLAPVCIQFYEERTRFKSLAIKEKDEFFYLENAEKYATDEATLHFSDLHKKYCEQIQKLSDAMKSVQDFEHNNGMFIYTQNGTHKFLTAELDVNLEAFQTWSLKPQK